MCTFYELVTNNTFALHEHFTDIPFKMSQTKSILRFKNFCPRLLCEIGKKERKKSCRIIALDDSSTGEEDSLPFPRIHSLE